MANPRPAGLAVDGPGRGGGLAGAYRAILDKLTLRVAAKTFYRNLTQTVASVTRARRVIFLELSDGYLRGISDAFGFGTSDIANIVLSCAVGDEMDGIESAVFEGQGIIRLRRGSGGSARELMDKLGATNEIAAFGWRWEDRPLGLIVACDTAEDGGFTDAHLSVLQAAGIGASIAWDHRRTVDALEQDRSRIESSALTAAARATLEQDIKLDLLSLTTAEIRAAISSRRAMSDGIPKRLDDLDAMVSDLRHSGAQRDVPLRLMPERVELGKLVAQVCEPFRNVLGARCDILEKVPNGLSLWADGHAIATLLATLITGLVRTCSNGSTIEVRTRKAKDAVHLLLSITPCGDAAKHSQAPAFERCRLLARMHGGELTADDDPAHQVAFILTLPLGPVSTRENEPADLFEVGSRSQIRVHEEFQTVERDGRRIRLSFNEWRLFIFMWRHPNTVFTIEELAVGAWNDSSKAVGQRIEVTVSRLRRKIERDPKRPNLLRTVFGKGYELALREANKTV